MLPTTYKSGPNPYLLRFEQFGDAVSGFITSTQQAANLPFAVKRIFWTYDTPTEKSRGGHANKQTQEIMVVVTGEAIVETENLTGKNETFRLDDKNTGLYIPANCWLTIKLQPGTILLCLASTDFDATDYIRDYNEFRSLQT